VKKKSTTRAARAEKPSRFVPHPDDAQAARDAFARDARGERMPQKAAYELLDELLGEPFPRPTK
jgi:hypothetical protein